MGFDYSISGDKTGLVLWDEVTGEEVDTIPFMDLIDAYLKVRGMESKLKEVV